MKAKRDLMIAVFASTLAVATTAHATDSPPCLNEGHDWNGIFPSIHEVEL